MTTESLLQLSKFTNICSDTGLSFKAKTSVEFCNWGSKLISLGLNIFGKNKLNQSDVV